MGCLQQAAILGYYSYAGRWAVAACTVAKLQGGNVANYIFDAQSDALFGDGAQCIPGVSKSARSVNEDFLGTFIVGVCKKAIV